MPLPALIIVVAVSIGCVIFLVQQVRNLRRQKRNLERLALLPVLEGVGDWD